MIQSLGDLVRRNARYFPDDIATVFAGRRTTQGAHLRRAERFGAAFLAAGCQRQDRVAILSLNSDLYLEAMAGCWLTGLVVSTVNFRLAAAEFAYILTDTQPHILLFEKAYAAALESIRDQIPVQHFVCLDSDQADAEVPGWAQGLGDFLATGDPALPAIQVLPHELATLIYTSGTTGRPKGVMRSHLAELTLGQQMAMMFDIRTGGRTLVVMPLFHAGAQSFTYAQMWRCGTLHIQRSFDPGAVLDAVERERLTHLHFVPQMLQAVLDAGEDRQVDATSVETIAYAAAPMTPALLRRALARFGPVFVNGWGMSEGNGTFLAKHKHHLEGPGAALLASIGQPNALADIRIVGDDGGDCEPGQTGEMWLRSDSVMTGYWNNSAATIEALRDGWLRTGDLGYTDAAGHIFLVDRKKDMIISGGENIYSQEVERAIAENPEVAAVAVIGVPDDKWGETVMAVVVPAAGAQPTAPSIASHCLGLIASYKKPRHVVFVAGLPLLQSGKVDKISLRKSYANPEYLKNGASV